MSRDLDVLVLAGGLSAEREVSLASGRRVVAALHEAGVLIAGEVLTSQSSTTTLTLRGGSLEVQDGPFAETKEGLAGVFAIDVPDLDAALGWVEKCPGAQFGVMEVRAANTSLIDGAWTASCPL